MKFDIGTYDPAGRGKPPIARDTITAAGYPEALAIAKEKFGKEGWVRPLHEARL